jgi:hypothetical protein
VLAKLFDWIAGERPRVDDDAPIAKAMNYVGRNDTSHAPEANAAA